MIRLRILGSPDLVGDDGNQLLSVLHRPKRLALLSFMAVECLGTYVRRDRLLGLFWPDSEERRARSSLSEALSQLRGSLGSAVVSTRGKEEIGLSPDHIWCDAADVLTAGGGDADLERVAALYRGPLLDAFFLDESSGFDHWLDSRRSRLERIALDTLNRLTDSTEASAPGSGIAWAERAVALCPSDGPSVRRLMTLQARSGHRTGALDAFEQYKRRLEDERGLEPAGELVDLASRIRSGDLWEDREPAAARRPRDSMARLRLISGGAEAHDERGLDSVPGREEFTEPLTDKEVVDQDQPPVRVERPAGAWKGVTVALAASALGVAGVVTWSLVRPESPAPVGRFEVTPPSASALLPSDRGVGFSVSPDGEHIVYVGVGGAEGRQLWLRRLQDPEPSAIAGTQGAFSPAFSLDGSAVAFRAGDALKMVSLAGERLSTVVDGLQGPSNPDWGPDGLIYYADGGDIYRVPSSGGAPEQVTTRSTDASAAFPHVLPDGRGLLVTLMRSDPRETTIGVAGPEGGEIRELTSGTTARYAFGQILYVPVELGDFGKPLMAAPFDLERLEITGPAAPVLENVAVGYGGRLTGAQIASSRTGTLVYRSAGTPASYQAVWIDRLGRVAEIDPGWTFYVVSSQWASLALSPDDRRLVVSISGERGLGLDLWIKQLETGPITRFTFDGAMNARASWSPDGEHIVYLRAGDGGAFRKRADGTGEAQRLLPASSLGAAVLSPNGEWLVYRTGPNEDTDLFALRPGVDSVGRPLVAERHRENAPALSPDGRWLAYGSDETGRFEVFVRPFPEVGSAKWQITTSGGTEPVWADSGGELFYRNGNDELVAVEVLDGPTFAAGRRDTLFSVASFLPGGVRPMFDVTSDGQRFIMLRDVAGQPDKLILVQNFSEVLRAAARN